MVFGWTRRDKGKKQVLLVAKDYVAANVPRKSSRKKKIKYAKIQEQELWSSFDV